MSLDDEKKTLRVKAKERRLAAFDKHGARAAEMIAAHGLTFCPTKPGQIVSGFSAIGEEIDAAPLMNRLHEEGFKLALPVIAGKSKPLIMRAWAPGDAMEEKTWGICEPLGSAPEVLPDILLVPLLAFDPQGYRLGYGGGFYDRTLAKLRALKPVIAIGLAYDEQLLDAVPRDSYDVPCDWVLTPSGPHRCS
ncbi:MAG: 5-formyltetrahydrofolate cyclo-ligase [Alphaproteobacteria bacterium BRH_c36]|nr:MAG: 5-formyltetrahydrofolate cyclo-ligase [Alphaproteobacteria bacterium BRH_c36]